MKHPIFFFFLFLFLSPAVQRAMWAQTDTLEFELEEIIALAQSDAPDVLLSQTRMKNRYWAYQSVLADFKPAINFVGELPDLNRSIDIITQPNGTDIFLQRAQMRNRLGLTLTQQIVQTGGTIFASTGLQRLDIFREAGDDLVSYYSTPVSIGLVQPVFGFNNLKWSKKIEPVRYQEATRQYAEEMEQVAYQAASFFFDVYIAQLDLEAAIRDKANADTLLVVSKGRFEVGRIAETELLNIELQAMKADAAVQEALLNLQTNTEKLRNFLGINRAVNFKMKPPTEMPVFDLDADKVLEIALKNRSNPVTWQRRILEAEQAIAQAKANSGFQMDISAVFSLSQTGEKIQSAYQNPLDNETFLVGFTIPIFDWGKARARLETATSNKELIRKNVEQDEANFEQEMRLKVKQFGLLRSKATLALRTYEVAIRKEQMTRNRYLIGKNDILDLNVAVEEKESTRRSYMSALRAFWLAYYDLRRSTLYDFDRNVSLVKSLDKLGN